MRVLTLAAAVTLVLIGPAWLARAQSLAELARQEAERRKAVKDTGRVITNKDLPKKPLVGTGPAADAAKATPGDKPDAAKAGTTGDDEKDEAYWAGRQKSLREQLERDETLAAAMQSRINALTTDFVNRDDPAQRAVIATDRQKALAELERLKKAIADGRKAIADFEEEARRAGVPPGWLR